jgi:hypothetical protein
VASAALSPRGPIIRSTEPTCVVPVGLAAHATVARRGGPWWRELAGWLGEMRRLITHLDGQADKVRVDQLGLGRADGADLHGRAQRRCWRPAVGLRQRGRPRTHTREHQ